ncbi:cupredoxin domain-containing protein [Paenibacillus sp. NEAU-GSW1]|uniref:cupredoxin domain-containing protein n=1 Tax=Paenibacillus sp. NEAU-GSW1 TaxID=2682486 RepID=UPI0012E20E71|nr:cupredoxin domain-containing protein [Paenibacillus sp. NEAU-GSW1]MUT67355.1 cytochrome C oxidase subunit II [Paenibacillus sp. NEAU-GSW1]
MFKKQFQLAAIAILAVMLVMSGCGKSTDNNANNNGGSNNAGTNAGGAAGTKDITVNAENWKFDQTDIKLNVGDTVNLTLKNTSGNHGLEIPDLKINIKDGETAKFTVDKAGTYEFVCSIMCGTGHADMKGKITVS